MDLAHIINALRSRDLRQQMVALDEAAEVVHALMSESLRTFRDSSDRFPIAQRLYNFGPPIVPMLEELFNQPIDEDARNQSAALLLELGSQAGLQHLMFLLSRRNHGFVMAARALGKAHVKEAAPIIRCALEEWDLDGDPFAAATLVGALKSIGDLPDSLIELLRRRWPTKMRAGLEKLLQE